MKRTIAKPEPAEALADALTGLLEAVTWTKERWVAEYGRGDPAVDDLRYAEAIPNAKRDLARAITAALSPAKESKE